MADELVRKLSFDISKATEALQKLEKEANKIFDRIDERTNKASKEIEQRKSNERSLRDAIQYQKDLNKAYDNYLRNLERETNKANRRDWNQSLQDAKQYYRDIEAQEKAYQKYLLEEEKIIKRLNEQDTQRYNEAVVRSAEATIDIWADASRRVVGYIREAFTDAIKYVNEYDKALTSIAVVKGDSSIKNTLGPQLEAMAREMSVTATELAAAAEELYRQGLDDSEVLSRMESITTYAKISGETFSEAVELITASVNSFAKEGESTADLTEHIVDVWSYLGDAVATSSGEIGTAMQKVAASGQAAGFTLEELSASIAVIESNTRAAAESVGTALNSMASRYMKVSSAGWNQFITTDEGDVVRINDIAKAMDSVGLSIVDANGKFLEFADVLNQLHTIWPTLSDAQKNYIATQMAGTRSLNYFLSLMNNYGDVLKLTEEAYNSAGTGAQKYAVWLEGAEAAQNRLTASLQDLYSDLVSSDLYIGVIDFLSNFIDNLGKGEIALGGVIALLGTAFSWFSKFRGISGSVVESLRAIWTGFTTAGTTAGAATVSITAFKAALMSIGVGIAITLVSALVTWLIKLGAEALNTADKVNELMGSVSKINDTLESGKTESLDYKNLARDLENLGNKTSYTADETERFERIRATIIDASPEIASAYGIEKDAVGALGEEYEATAASLKKLREEQALENWDIANEGLDTAKELVDQYNEISNIQNVPIDKNVQDVHGWADRLILDFDKESAEAEIHELRHYIDVFSIALDDYVSLMNDEAQSKFGNIGIDFNNTLLENEQVIEERINHLRAINNGEFGFVSAETIKANIWEINALNEYADSLADVYGRIYNLKDYQAKYEYAANERDRVLAKSQREAWEVIITSASNAALSLKAIDVDLYQLVLDSLMGGDYSGMSGDEIYQYVSDVFMNITGAVKAEMDNIDAEIIDATAGLDYSSMTKAMYEYLLGLDKAMSDAMSESTSGRVTEANTDADSYTQYWESVIDSLYGGLGRAFRDQRMTDEIMAQLSDKDFTAEVYDALVAALAANPFNRQEIIDLVLNSITSEEALEVLVPFTIVPDVEADTEQSAFEAYEAAEKIRDNIQLLYDSAHAMGTGGEVDFSALFEAYPQLIEYASDRIALQEQINILLASETEANEALLEQYGLQIEKVEDLNDALNAHAKGENKAADAATKLRKGQSLTADTLKDLIDEYPELTKAILDFADGTLDAEELIKKLDKAAAGTNVQNFADQFTEIGDQLSGAVEGSYEYNAALERMGYLMTGGMGEMNSLEFAKAHLDDIRAAIEGDIDAFYRLAQAAVINIVGSANVDFSAAEDGLWRVNNASQQTLDQLLKLGLFEIETVSTENEFTIVKPSGATVTLPGPNTYHLLKPTFDSGFTPPKSKSGGSSPKGGGSSDKTESPKVSKKVQRKINEAERKVEPYDYRLEIAQALQEYYEATGQLGKSIPFIQEQIDIYKELAEIYKQNVEELQPLADAKKKEIDQTESEIDKLKKKRDQYEKGSAEYKKYTKKIKELKEELDVLNLDYDELIEKIQEYELAGLDAAKTVELLNQAIKDQQRAIRQTVIDVKNQLRDYFEEIEEAEKKQLDSTISMQDRVLEILREQAKEELDIQKERLGQKKSMLEEELDALRENFEEARKLAEENETQQTLEDKQRELAAVMTDPTRAKERAALEKEIAELQTDLAWQTAEEQIAAQEAAVQEEIDAIDIELNKLEEAYDEIEAFNEEMIQKMKEILEMNSDDIVKWLKDNSSEYADSTDEARQKLEDDWKVTAENMKGIIEDIWKDIDNIMKGGLDEAIELLRKTDKYKNASDEERQEMEDQLRDLWKDMDVADDPPEPDDRTPGDNNNKEEAVEPEDPTLTVTTRNREVELHKKYKGDSKVLKTIPKKTELVLDGYHGKWVRTNYDGKTGWVKIDDIKTEFDKKKLKKYAQGGLLDSTGPIWVDGTVGRPERILSAHQNELFERFIATLEKWKMPNFDGHTDTSSETLHVEEGAIVVQIGSLNDGSDYDEVGQKVMDAIYQKFKVRR